MNNVQWSDLALSIRSEKLSEIELPLKDYGGQEDFLE